MSNIHIEAAESFARKQSLKFPAAYRAAFFEGYMQAAKGYIETHEKSQRLKATLTSEQERHMQTANPTEHGPGSEGKIEVLTERYASGHSLWHPDDSTQYTGPPHRPTEDDFGSGVFFDEEEEVLP